MKKFKIEQKTKTVEFYLFEKKLLYCIKFEILLRPTAEQT